jgi:hypothetical protein
MSYSPKYCGDNASDSYSNVEGIIQFDLTANSSPSESQVLKWIEEVETDVKERNLGNETASNEVFDVDERLEGVAPPVGTIEGFESYATGAYVFEEGVIVLPPRRPIVSVSSLYRRTSAMGGTESWESYTQGLSGDFILRTVPVGTRSLGWCVYIFDTLPATGFQRLKMTYNYGWNVPSAVLREYCCLKVSVKILNALKGTTHPGGMRQFVGRTLQSYVPDNYVSRISDLLARCGELEKEHFPAERSKIAVGVL